MIFDFEISRNARHAEIEKMEEEIRKITKRKAGEESEEEQSQKTKSLFWKRSFLNIPRVVVCKRKEKTVGRKMKQIL